MQRAGKALEQPLVDAAQAGFQGFPRAVRVGQDGIAAPAAHIQPVRPAEVQPVQQFRHQMFFQQIQIKRPAPQGFQNPFAGNRVQKLLNPRQAAGDQQERGFPPRFAHTARQADLQARLLIQGYPWDAGRIIGKLLPANLQGGFDAPVRRLQPLQAALHPLLFFSWADGLFRRALEALHRIRTEHPARRPSVQQVEDGKQAALGCIQLGRANDNPGRPAQKRLFFLRKRRLHVRPKRCLPHLRRAIRPQGMQQAFPRKPFLFHKTSSPAELSTKTHRLKRLFLLF